MTNKIFYVRDGDNNPVGMLIALQAENGIDYDISWSYCRREDQFSREQSILWAKLRQKNKDLPGVMPHKIRNDLAVFALNCQRYYKGIKLHNICNNTKKMTAVGKASWERTKQTIINNMTNGVADTVVS